MKIEQDRNLTAHARALRRKMTKEERKLWYTALCKSPVRFRRQQVVGSYIVDFYCDSARLAIELDGSQHYKPKEQWKDEERTRSINKQGIMVIRFSNAEVNEHFDAVCEKIYRILKERIPELE